MINSDDLNNRKLIETDTSTNYFVEAGAGSGKTTELVRRMIAMVENGIDVREICAITFTKAAANEFYDRFQKALIKSGTPKAKEALKNIDLCFMGTIDSFTNMIISEHPSEAGVPADSCVVDNEEIHELWLSQLSGIANGNFGKELEDKYKLFVKYCRNSESYFISALDFLMSTKNAEIKYEKPKVGNFEDIFHDEIEEIKMALNYLVGNGTNVLNKSKGDKTAIYFARLALDLCDNFEANLDAILRALNKLSGKSGLRFDKTEDIESYTNMPAYVRNLFYRSLTDKGRDSFWIIKDAKSGGNPFHRREFDTYIFNIALDFAVSSMDIISKNLKLQGKLSFSDYLYYLKETLKKDAFSGGKLISHINKRHKYYLIDEFQDTDPIQAEIFFYLTASNLDNIKSWKDCVPLPGTLFIVGDPKQSIYRFRNADVASYLNVKKLFENEAVGKVLILSQNFRSYKPLCGWFNKAFSEILKDEPGIQSAYAEIPLKDKKEYKASFGGAQKQIYIGKSLKTSPAANNLVTIINEIVDNDKYTIEDPPRKIKYKDIMIISYRKKHLKFYMDALLENNIPYWVEGNVLFDDCPALTALSAILNYVLNPENKKMEDAVNLLTADPIDQNIAFEYKKKSTYLTSVSLASLLIDEQKIIAQYGTKNIEYLYYAIELLRDKENSGEITTLAEAARFISSLVAGDSDIERCLQFADDDNRVHLANLHKVKGLQAPVVIMVQANSTNHDPQKHVDYMSENPISCMFEIKGKGFNSKLVNWSHEEEKQFETKILEAEKDRLLYVAATRAKSIFIATDYKLKSGKVPADNQAINLLEQIDTEISIGDSRDDQGNIIVNDIRQAEAKPPITDRLVVDELYALAGSETVLNPEAEAPTYTLDLPSKAEHKDIPLSDINLLNNKRNAAFIGTIVHRLMELCVSSSTFDESSDKFVAQVINEFNVSETSDIDALNKAATEISKLYSKVNGAEEIYCEMPFCYMKDENTICEGVMDLVYKDKNGWHIIDYKTNFDDRFLDIKYENQLNEYKDALKNILGVDCTAEIFHIAV